MTEHPPELPPSLKVAAPAVSAAEKLYDDLVRDALTQSSISIQNNHVMYSNTTFIPPTPKPGPPTPIMPAQMATLAAGQKASCLFVDGEWYGPFTTQAYQVFGDVVPSMRRDLLCMCIMNEFGVYELDMSNEQIAYILGKKEKEPRTMLQQILKLYHTAMLGDVRTPLPHLVGPPGTGKSTVIEQVARLVGKKLHIINVSRMSPLEIEGVQMPVENNTKLLMLTASWWQELNDGDIVLFDEFLRGFPEVYNGLLDILTARRVGSFHLPHVFFIAASNSVATYDSALEDRLLHLTVPDIRKDEASRRYVYDLMVKDMGLHPDMASHADLQYLVQHQVMPTYKMLDAFQGKSSAGSTKMEGASVRNLIGQVRMRELKTTGLRSLVSTNNAICLRDKKFQFLVLTEEEIASSPTFDKVEQTLRGLVHHPNLTDLQRANMRVNLCMFDLVNSTRMQAAKAEKDQANVKEIDFDDPLS